MPVVGLRTSIRHNKRRLLYLMSLLPAVVILAIFLSLWYAHGAINDDLIQSFTSISGLGLIILFVWMVIGIYFQKRIIFGFTGAKEITRSENPKIYNIVENLCISRGIMPPKVGIIDDNSLNAFATGWDKKNSRIVFSKGLLEKLNDKEIEAVAGHELTHILNGDVKNMVIVNVFIGAIGTIGYILMRSGGGGKKKNPFPIIGLALYLLSILLLPLINLAISRKKEFLADAGSVDLTHDKYAMISALQKISTDSVIENIEGKSNTISSMFFENPKHQRSSKLFSSFSTLLSTHPSTEDRIAMLEKY